MEQKKILVNSSWLVFRECSNALIRVLGVFILMRFLLPEDYGFYSMILGIQQFFLLISQAGINVYIVKSHPKEILNHSLFTLSLIVSTIITLVLCPFIFIHDKTGTALLLWVTLPISVVSIVPQGLLEKTFDFKKISKVSIISQVIFYIVSIPMAIMKMGVLAPIFGQILMALFSTLMFFKQAKYKPIIILDKKELKNFTNFGFSYAVSTMAFSSKNLIYFIASYFISKSEIGIIAFIFRLIDSLNLLSIAVKKIIISILAKIQDNKESFKKAIEISILIQVIINSIILVIFDLFAKLVIMQLGSHWKQAIDIIPFIAPYVLMLSLSAILIPVLQITSKNFYVALFYLANSIILCMSFILLLPYFKITGIGISLLVALPTVFILYYAIKDLKINFNITLLCLFNSIICLVLIKVNIFYIMLLPTPFLLKWFRIKLKNYINYFLLDNINLYWYKMGNVGDELGPYIISKLTGKNIRHIPIVDNTFITFIKLIRRFIKSDKGTTLKEALITPLIDKTILSIGSIIEHNSRTDSLIWGSGLICENGKVTKANYYAVRGNLTKAIINRHGIDVQAIGDPAILLPFVYTPKPKKTYDFGIIPHYSHYNIVKKNINDNSIAIIDMMGDIEETIDHIYSCSYTLASSLHGLIISHAYGIKSLWFNDISLPKLYLGSFKFLDYLSTIDPELKTPQAINIKNFNKFDIINSIEQNCNIINIQAKLKELQLELLKSAPFKIKDSILQQELIVQYA